MRRTILAAVAAAVITTGLLASVAASASTSRERSTTIHLTAHFTSATIVDAGDPGSSPGDQQVVAGTLSHGSTKVGAFGFICEFLTVGSNAQEQCSGTGRLAHGTITVEGFSRQSSDDHVWAVVGGTGAYSDAGGQALIHDVDDTTSQVTLELG